MTTPAFTTSEGLRLLLLNLAYGGTNAWECSPEAAWLMTYTMDKYGALARKYGREPTDAAVAAFDAMRMRSTRVAVDPWAVITHAVELTLIYESRAEGLLCSTGQARKSAGTGFHDAERFSDRDSEIADYHPAFHVWDDVEEIEGAPPPNPDGEPTNAFFALDMVVEFFVEVGWQPRTARLAMEYIAARMIQCGKPRAAYASLRRDSNGPGLLDINQRSWVGVLRAVLGDPSKNCTGTDRGKGMLLRLVTGDDLSDLFEDRELTNAVEDAAPTAEPTPSSWPGGHDV